MKHNKVEKYEVLGELVKILSSFRKNFGWFTIKDVYTIKLDELGIRNLKGSKCCNQWDLV